ncbi:hypothetical protein BOKEGFJH_00468 [Chlamydia avium]|uniref:Secreted protein n=1 Tax=Chlamydia avium TaxID=1457141 RepID=A0ABP2X5D5_9CHLA|nr:hypothetical protein [Chlamydia avium]EPP36034.1 hypothetical protein CP10743SC13_0810 [Chlamydia psittaci 10_743_SC13]EPP38013.1 hypothetical protein CP10881SC42_0892 [Chlamydia avium]VVT42942.1 hypothetical protein BOKEGFJH_00468 [Chlamydia avium]
MVKRFFICNLAFILSLCSPIFTEDNTQIETVDTPIVNEENIVSDLNMQLDGLFQVFLEEGQELYQDLLMACQNECFENDIQIMEFIKSSDSGKKLLQACEKILTDLHKPSDELTDKDLSCDVLLQKLDEIVKLWQENHRTKDWDYAYRELELREKELEFKKDLLSWQREKYAKDIIMRRFS